MPITRASSPRRLRAPLLAVLLLLASALPAAALPVQRVVSPGGIVAWLVEDHSNPLLSVSAGFRGGAALDPADKVGLAQLASGLLTEGAGDLDSAAFQLRLVHTATELGFAASEDNVIATMRTLTESRDAGLELLRLALTAPRFDTEPLERLRGQMLALLVRQASDPAAAAQLTWQSAAFPDHPYGRDSMGTPQTLAAITVDDLRRFVADRLARDNLYIGVVGDVTAAELGPLLDSTFAGLPATGAPSDVPEAKAGGAGRVIVVDRDIPQSVITFGHDGIAYVDPDYYAAMAVNHVLGAGGFASRLTEEVRVKRGLAYTIYTTLMPFDHGALITGQAGTQNARVGETLQLIRQEWARMHEEGPTEQELAEAKTFLTGIYPLRFTSTIATAKLLVTGQLDGFDSDFFSRRNSYVEAVTMEDARRVARRLLDPDKLLVVIAGKPEGVTPTPLPEPAGAAPDANKPGDADGAAAPESSQP